MSLAGKTLKVCSCNRTVPLDAKALAAALKSGEPLTVHHELCRKDAGAFQAALGDSDVIVACTQEASLFGELASESQSNIKFVNVRELAGWSSEKSTPKIAALVAMAALPEPEPVPAVEFKSQGQALIIGPAAAALDWAERLSGQLEVSVLIAGGPGESFPSKGNTRSGRARSRSSAAGSARSRSNGARTTRSTSKSARAAMPACAPARKRRSASTTRSISPSARITASASKPAALSARSTSRARTLRARKPSTSC